MMNRWYLDSSTPMRVQSGAFCWQGDIEAVNYYMNKVASEIFSFFDVGMMRSLLQGAFQRKE